MWGDRQVALAVAGNAEGVKESQAYAGNAVSQPREIRKKTGMNGICRQGATSRSPLAIDVCAGGLCE